MGSGRRCFVGFYGLNRSLRWTARSIHRNVLGPLKEAGFETFVAGHFNQPDVIDSAHSGERGIRAPRDAEKALPLDLCWAEPQSVDNIAPLLETAFSVDFRDGGDEAGDIRRNILHQLHSLRRLGAMLDLIGRDQFDVFVFLRPDIEYIDPLDIGAVEAISQGKADMVTPSWHQWGGLNDRFAFCNRKAADAYLGRWDRVEPHCKAHGYIHPETLLADAASDLRLITTDQRAVRIRSNGECVFEGFKVSPIYRLTLMFRPVLATLTPAA